MTKPTLWPQANETSAQSPSPAAAFSAEVVSKLRPAKHNELPQVRQLYLSLYKAIEQGELPFACRLPSSRVAAQQLGIARNTVISVYEQLTIEGLLETAGRNGTRVARMINRLSENKTTHWASSKRSSSNDAWTTKAKELAPGEPDTGLFPQSVFRKALSSAALIAQDNLGYEKEPLTAARESIARYLATYRSLVIDPGQIIITASTRQSLTLAAHLYADVGDTAWVECPGYLGAVDAFRQSGLSVQPCDIEHNGMVIPTIKTRLPKLIYLTPCFQYPYGMPLGAEKRSALLNMSRENGCVLFEDDYDSEFRSDTQPRPALASDASGARVLHAGTFSKLLFPAIRVGWLIVPSQSIEQAHRCLRVIGGGNNIIAQAAIAELLDSGAITRHLKRARQVYGQRKSALLDALSESDWFEPADNHAGGLNMVLTLRNKVPLHAINTTLRKNRIGAQPIEKLQWNERHAEQCKALVAGLGNVDSLAIPAAVTRMHKALQQASRYN